MEVALQSIFILFFVALPGVIFRRFYYQGEFTKQFDSKGWSHSIFLSLVFGFGIHTILFIAFYLSNNLITLDHINELLTCIETRKIPDLKTYQLDLIYWYLILLFLSPLFLGFLFHSLIRLLNWDLKYSIFRFANHWHYYFKGEIRKHPDFPTLNEKKKEKVILTRADVLCKNDENKNNLYSGILSQYTICKSTGKLDYIYLTLPQKIVDFTSNVGNQTVNKFNEINSDCLILKEPNIINISLKYLYEKKKSQDYGKLFRPIIFGLYLFNWIEPITITRFGIESAIAIKLTRHLFIFSFINAIHSSVSKSLRGDSRVGFWFLSILSFAAYMILRSFMSTMN